MMSIIWGLIVLLALLALWFASAYNRLVHRKALVDEAWSGIDVQLKRRYDLIPNLVAVVKQYGTHEKDIFVQVAHARSAAMSARGIENKSQAEEQLTTTLKTLFAVAENYPQLKANQNFLELQNSLVQIEQDIQLSRRYYNGTARNYNTAVRTLPTNVIARLNGFETVPYFELNNSQERENPHVSF